jgi:hypothetical protein
MAALVAVALAVAVSAQETAPAAKTRKRPTSAKLWPKDDVLLTRSTDAKNRKLFQDGPPLEFSRRLVAAITKALPAVLVRADPAVFKRRRFGNVVIAASTGALPVAAVARAAASAMFPHQVLAGAALAAFVGAAVPLSDAAPMRSPVPPDEIWRVGS